jgi:hypothetical protein
MGGLNKQNPISEGKWGRNQYSAYACNCETLFIAGTKNKDVKFRKKKVLLEPSVGYTKIDSITITKMISANLVDNNIH